MNIVMDMMKIGNIVPRGEFEPTYIAFWASALTITPHRVVADVTILANYVAHERSVQTISITLVPLEL